MVSPTFTEHPGARLRRILATSLAAVAAAGAWPAWCMDKPAPAEGAGAAPASPATGTLPEPASDPKAKLAKLEKLVEATGDQLSAGEVQVAKAKHLLATAHDLEAEAAARASLERCEKALAAHARLHREARARRDALARQVSLETPPAGSGPEAKGDAKTSGAEGKAGTAAAPPRRAGHPFFGPSPKHGPGTVLRFNIQFGRRRGQAIGKLVRTANGTFYWVDPETGGLGGLGPGLAPGLSWLNSPGEDRPPRDLIDLLACGDTVWCFSGRPGSGYRMHRMAGDGQGSGFTVSARLDRAPFGFLPWTPRSRNTPAIVAPDKVLFTHVAGREFVMKTLPVDGLVLGPSTRFQSNPANTVMYFHDPDRHVFGRLLPDRATAGFQVQPLCLPSSSPIGSIAVTTSREGGQDRDTIYATYPDADTVAAHPVGTGRKREFRLVDGTAPGAMVHGPGGSLLFTTAHGFGCLAPDGRVTRIPVQGGLVAPVALVPGQDSGRLYFTEAGRPFISALVLADPGAEGKGPAVPPGPSLLAADQAGPPAAVRVRKKTPPKRAMEPRPAGSRPGVGAAAVETKVAAEPDPEGETAEAEAPSGDEPAAEAEVPLDEEGAEADRARGHVRFKQVAEAFRHICDGHLGGEAEGAATGKSQFNPDLSYRQLSTLLVRGANHPDALVYYKFEEDKESRDGHVEVTIYEFSAAGTVGRVRRPDTGAWADTRRVRVVQKTRPDTGETYVASAYPIP